jgi:threonine dehydrogenase-like Zn-dependent dehydrogenase
MRVLMFRGHASHTVAVEGPTGGIVVEVPEGIEPDVAAASRMAAVATTSIVVAEWGMAPWVAVYGLGPVGNLAAQACGIMGARVIGVDPKAGRRAVAEQCGIKNVIGGSSEEVRQSIRDITGGEMAAISIDAVGHSSVVLEAVRVTKDFGQVLLLGSPRAPVAGNLTELLSALHLHSITMRSALEWCIPIRPDTGVKISHIEKQKAIFDWIRRGVLHVAPLISHRMPPSEIRKAYEGLLEQSDVFTGVALDWRT